ncbi:hypothetical protein BKA82DRAFT_4364672 [Pisolithus tinctorius]|nr:hypothetical protein BKA82DRAFT_4364672 [Pisolithus tinctorius]
MSGSTISNSSYSEYPEFYTQTVTFLVRLASAILFSSSNKSPLLGGGFSASGFPGKPLEAESTVFRDMFLLPQGPAKEFPRRNLKVYYVPSCTDNMEQTGASDLDYDQWVSVLKLSTMWEFTGLRNAAIRYLDHPLRPLDPISKVELALQYNIRRVKKGSRIGFENALKLASVREKLSAGDGCGAIHSAPTTPGLSIQYNTQYLVVGDRDQKAENLDYTLFIRQAFDL